MYRASRHLHQSHSLPYRLAVRLNEEISHLREHSDQTHAITRDATDQSSVHYTKGFLNELAEALSFRSSRSPVEGELLCEDA